MAHYYSHDARAGRRGPGAARPRRRSRRRGGRRTRWCRTTTTVVVASRRCEERQSSVCDTHHCHHRDGPGAAAAAREERAERRLGARGCRGGELVVERLERGAVDGREAAPWGVVRAERERRDHLRHRPSHTIMHRDAPLHRYPSHTSPRATRSPRPHPASGSFVVQRPTPDAPHPPLSSTCARGDAISPRSTRRARPARPRAAGPPRGCARSEAAPPRARRPRRRTAGGHAAGGDDEGTRTLIGAAHVRW